MKYEWHMPGICLAYVKGIKKPTSIEVGFAKKLWNTV